MHYIHIWIIILIRLYFFQLSYTTFHSGHHTTVSASVDKVSDYCPSRNINQALGETVLHHSLHIEHQASTALYRVGN
jgi:hypothetical protein